MVFIEYSAPLPSGMFDQTVHYWPGGLAEPPQKSRIRISDDYEPVSEVGGSDGPSSVAGSKTPSRVRGARTPSRVGGSDGRSSVPGSFDG